MTPSSIGCASYRRVDRRGFLTCGALTAAGLTLADVFRLQAATGAARDRAVILLWMDGGPSHIDTFDPKPDAPAEVRGEFASIPTSVPGVRVCEHLPRIARRMDRLALVRSLHHGDNLHEGAIHWVQTGHGYPRQFDPVNARQPRNPAAGAVAARQRGPVRAGLPAYVKLLKDGGYEHSYQGAVYLGRQFDPLAVGEDVRATAFREPFNPLQLAAPALALPQDIAAGRLDARRALAAQLEALRDGVESNHALDQIDTFRRQAYELLLSGAVRDAFDLSKEDPRLRDGYGGHVWGQATLLARRLVEAGVRFVTVNLHGDPPTHNPFSWDCHSAIFPAMKDYLLPVFDRLLSGLVDDLQQRALIDRVLVMAVGEFGRTPKVEMDTITKKGGAGRSHWGAAFSALLAGGIRPGQVIGATDLLGREPKDRPVMPQDLLATVYAWLGIDSHAVNRDEQGRPIPVLADGRPIQELL